MREVLVTPAAINPVTLDEAKLHLRVTHDSEDTLIESQISAATRYCEDRIGQQFITATWRLLLDCFPAFIWLPRPPLITVTSLTYVDTAGATQTLATSEYQINSQRRPAAIAPARNKFWPSIDHETFNPVQVNYTAGYGPAETDVPESAKQAIKLLVSHWYYTREPILTGTISTKIDLTLDSLLAMIWHGGYANAR